MASNSHASSSVAAGATPAVSRSSAGASYPTPGLQFIDLEAGWSFLMERGIKPLENYLRAEAAATKEAQHQRGTDGSSPPSAAAAAADAAAPGGNTPIFSRKQYSEMYTTVYNMCTQRYPNNFSSQLYHRYGQVIASYLTREVLPAVERLKEEELLREVLQRWQQHKTYVKWLQRVFVYLDRYYVKLQSEEPLQHKGVILFRHLVFDRIRVPLRKALLGTIQRYRTGRKVEEELVSATVDLYVGLDGDALCLYQREFEDFYLPLSSEHYTLLSEQWLETCSFSQYIQHAQEALVSEQQRCLTLLHPSTTLKLQAVVVHATLTLRQKQLFAKETAVEFLLQRNMKQQLMLTHRLFTYVEGGIEAVACVFKKFIVQQGNRIVDERLEMINSANAAASSSFSFSSSSSSSSSSLPVPAAPAGVAAASEMKGRGCMQALAEAQQADTAFVQRVLNLHDHYRRLVEDCFTVSASPHPVAAVAASFLPGTPYATALLEEEEEEEEDDALAAADDDASSSRSFSRELRVADYLYSEVEVNDNDDPGEGGGSLSSSSSSSAAGASTSLLCPAAAPATAAAAGSRLYRTAVESEQDVVASRGGSPGGSRTRTRRRRRSSSSSSSFSRSMQLGLLPDPLFQKALKEAFESIVNRNMEKQSFAVLLSSFCDRLLKRSPTEKRSEEQLEVLLMKAVDIFNYLTEKDIFAECYRNQLGRRLLHETSTSEELERSIILRLKQKCGAHFTSRLEGMLHDLGTAAEIYRAFTRYLHQRVVAAAAKEEAAEAAAEEKAAAAKEKAAAAAVRGGESNVKQGSSEQTEKVKGEGSFADSKGEGRREKRGTGREAHGGEPGYTEGGESSSRKMATTASAEEGGGAAAGGEGEGGQGRNAEKGGEQHWKDIAIILHGCAPVALVGGIEFTVQILTTGHWPTYPATALKLPPAMQRCRLLFEEFYAKQTQHRRLTWIPTLGTSLVRATFEKRHDLICNTCQACVLLLLNYDSPYDSEEKRKLREKQKEQQEEETGKAGGQQQQEGGGEKAEELTKKKMQQQQQRGRDEGVEEQQEEQKQQFQEEGMTKKQQGKEESVRQRRRKKAADVKQRKRRRRPCREDPKVSLASMVVSLGLEEGFLKKMLASLYLGRFKLVKKLPDELYQADKNFTCVSRKIKLPTPVQEEAQNRERVEEDRSIAVEAAIVRVMKARKWMTHQQLMSEVLGQLSFFKPNPKVIKKRLEHLIEREFIERDRDDSNVYRYVA